jgi:hypothetical protein
MVTGKKHGKAGLSAPQNPRSSAFICGSLLHGHALIEGVTKVFIKCFESKSYG